MTEWNGPAQILGASKFSPDVWRVVEDAAMGSEAWREALIAAPCLSEARWLEMYRYSPLVKVSKAERLAGRKLNVVQQLHILKRECRIAPLAALVTYNELGVRAQKAYLENPDKGQAQRRQLDRKVFRSSKTRTETRMALMARPDNEDLQGEILELSEPHELPFAEAVTVIEALPRNNAYMSERQVAAVCTRRPELMDAFASPGQRWYVVAGVAGSLSLVDPELLKRLADGEMWLNALAPYEYSLVLRALATNPVVPVDLAREAIEAGFEAKSDAGYTSKVFNDRINDHGEKHLSRPFQDIEDLDDLAWLVDAIIRRHHSGLGTGAKVIEDTCEVAANERLTEAMARRLLDCHSVEDWKSNPKYISTYVEMCRKFPPSSSWQIYQLGEVQSKYQRSKMGGPKWSPHSLTGHQLWGERLQEAADWLVKTLGDRQAVWEVFVEMSQGFEGTYLELAEIALAAGT